MGFAPQRRTGDGAHQRHDTRGADDQRVGAGGGLDIEASAGQGGGGKHHRRHDECAVALHRLFLHEGEQQNPGRADAAGFHTASGG